MLRADGTVHQVLRLLAQLLHQHVLGGQGHAAVAPANRLSDALHVVKDSRGLLGREQSKRMHARGTCARTRLLAGAHVELKRRRRAGCEDRGAHACGLRGTAAAADAEQLDERVDAERAARGNAQLVRLRRLLLAHLAGPARDHPAHGLAGRRVLCIPALKGPETHRARLVAVSSLRDGRGVTSAPCKRSTCLSSWRVPEPGRGPLSECLAAARCPRTGP